MRVIVQLIDLNEPLRAGITSHISANWPSVIIAVGEAPTQQNPAFQSSLVIRAKRGASARTIVPLRETISVEGRSLEEAVFQVDAKLGKLTKSNILRSETKKPINSPMSSARFPIWSIQQILSTK